MPISDPPSAGRHLLHFPADDRCAPAPAFVDVADRGDGVLVWTDPHTGSIFGTGLGFPRLSSAYHWERVKPAR